MIINRTSLLTQLHILLGTFFLITLYACGGSGGSGGEVDPNGNASITEPISVSAYLNRPAEFNLYLTNNSKESVTLTNGSFAEKTNLRSAFSLFSSSIGIESPYISNVFTGRTLAPGQTLTLTFIFKPSVREADSAIFELRYTSKTGGTSKVIAYEIAGTVLPGVPPEELIDTDKDGIPNHSDNCAIQYNPLQEDSDSDGVGNICDTGGSGGGGSGTPVRVDEPGTLKGAQEFRIDRLLSYIQVSDDISIGELDGAYVGINFGDTFDLDPIQGSNVYIPTTEDGVFNGANIIVNSDATSGTFDEANTLITVNKLKVYLSAVGVDSAVGIGNDPSALAFDMTLTIDLTTANVDLSILSDLPEDSGVWAALADPQLAAYYNKDTKSLHGTFPSDDKRKLALSGYTKITSEDMKDDQGNLTMTTVAQSSIGGAPYIFLIIEGQVVKPQ